VILPKNVWPFAHVNASLISGLNGRFGIALDGEGDLFVDSAVSGVVGEYTTSGATVNASLISALNTGLDTPSGIAVAQVTVPDQPSRLITLLGAGVTACQFTVYKRFLRRAFSRVLVGP
jgi:hypothetical protein